MRTGTFGLPSATVTQAPSKMGSPPSPRHTSLLRLQAHGEQATCHNTHHASEADNELRQQMVRLSSEAEHAPAPVEAAKGVLIRLLLHKEKQHITARNTWSNRGARIGTQGAKADGTASSGSATLSVKSNGLAAAVSVTRLQPSCNCIAFKRPPSIVKGYTRVKAHVESVPDAAGEAEARPQGLQLDVGDFKRRLQAQEHARAVSSRRTPK